MKLGLALSGGGFRAAFFHIGVLARMAEIGKLRQVEVISTVSGGSIVGAMYYVKLKKLFETNISPSNEQLVQLVQELEIEFLEGVQKNIRMRTFLNPLKNLKMSLASYSRSDRLAELYDKFFYRPVLNPVSSEMIKMRDLKINPGGRPAHPDEFNKTSHQHFASQLPIINTLIENEACKLPIILINATSLNSGHNWRFEASRMGEPDATGSKALSKIDKNCRFSRPKTYEDMPERPRETKLGHAVAASACVPALFHPLSVSELYQEDCRIQLVDGGVHDNQGIQALIDRQCDEMIVSDASGHMSDETAPSTQIHQVLMRSNKILMDRVREEELKSILDDNDIKVTFMHLRQGLTKKTFAYINEPNPITSEPSQTLCFGVHPEIQDAVSHIRTDLDSFSDIEADTLMADGYLMSKYQFEEKKAKIQGNWRFSYMFDLVTSNNNPELIKHLKTSSKQFLKVFFLKPMISITLFLLLAAIIGGAIWWSFGDQIQAYLDQPLNIETRYDLFIYIAVAALFMILSFLFARLKVLYSLRKSIWRFLAHALLPALGSIFIMLHLVTFDKVFLKAGKREKFIKQRKE
ncbi:NTE family protein [Nitrosomonas marina]|uniref:NTE family protein n=1 Tax=Nitrosomonas marina TaxID=917 RepID=A0A1I0BMN9_9PROT|nr:patatin-like phospholipase family protein [Nitrosomonas marina]SET08127.1 NTE family protein [Nitrosomonas marina]